MMLLTTGQPSANHCDDRIIATVPNGDHPVQIAMTLHEALALTEGLRRATVAMIDAQRPQAQAQAEIIPFHKRGAAA